MSVSASGSENQVGRNVSPWGREEFLDQAPKRLNGKIFTGPNVIEDFLAKDEEAPVNPDSRFTERIDSGHVVIVAQGDRMEGLGRFYGDQTRNPIAAPEGVGVVLQ